MERLVGLCLGCYLQHGLDRHGLLGDLHVHREDVAVARLQLDGRHCVWKKNWRILKMRIYILDF